MPKNLCPHCQGKLQSRMIDIDWTNLIEKEVCEICGYGYPSIY
jgi:transcription elongation factor Elf1